MYRLGNIIEAYVLCKKETFSDLKNCDAPELRKLKITMMQHLNEHSSTSSGKNIRVVFSNFCLISELRSPKH